MGDSAEKESKGVGLTVHESAGSGHPSLPTPRPGRPRGREQTGTGKGRWWPKADKDSPFPEYSE